MKLSGDADHPAGVLSPEGKPGPWRVTIQNIAHSTNLIATYSAHESLKWALASIDLAPVKEQLTVTGSVKILRIDLVLESQHNSGDATCTAGMHGTVVVTDDKRKLANGQTRDQVVANFPGCPVFSHVYSNADSSTHTPSFGGVRSGERGGQLARVSIDVQPTELTFTVNQGGDVGTYKVSIVTPTSSIGPRLNGVNRKAPILISGKLDEPLPKGWDFHITRIDDPVSQGNGVYYTVCHTAEGTNTCDLCPGGLRGLQPANVSWQTWYTKTCGPVIKRPPNDPNSGYADQVCAQLVSPTPGQYWGACIDLIYSP